MLLIASNKNSNRKSKSQSVMLPMLSELAIYGIMINSEPPKNEHLQSVKSGSNEKKCTDTGRVNMKESHMRMWKDIWERNLLRLNYNKEILKSHMEELFDILYLKAFTKEDGGASFLEF